MRITHIGLTALAMGLLAAGATSQHHDHDTKSQERPEPPKGESTTLTSTTSGSALVGRVVEDAEGAVLGIVRDLLIDGHGRLRVALVDDSSGELRGVSMGRLRTSPTPIVADGEAASAGDATLVMTEADGALLPTAPATATVERIDASWLAQVDAHFGVLQRSVTTEPSSGEEAADGTTPAVGVLSAAELMDFDLRNLADESLGTVEDLALDLEILEVRYAVIRLAGAEEESGLHAIPFDAMRTNGRQSVLRIDMDEQALSRSPKIDRVGESLEVQG